MVAVLAAGMLLAACGDDDDSGGGGGGGGDEGGGGSIALLLPESKTARYESQDRPNFEKKVAELCPDCEIIYSNADQDPAKQQQQAEAALTKGAKVMVLDPVDAASAGAIVARAKQSQVPVISYDRLITDADIDYYISFDNEQVGKLQGESLQAKLEEDGNGDGTIVMINGAPTDNNAKLFKQGAMSRLRPERPEGRQVVRHPRLEPGQGPAGDGAGDHGAGQGRLRGRLRRQRRDRGRCDRGHEGQRHRSQDHPLDGAGRRAGRHPADPGRRAVHDRLQGDQAGGRAGRGAGGRARAGQGSPRAVWSTARSTTARRRCPRSCSRRWR